MSLRDSKGMRDAAGSDRRESSRRNRDGGRDGQGRERRGDARRARERDARGNADADPSGMHRQMNRLTESVTSLAQQVAAGGALPAPGTPLHSAGHVAAVSPTMSHTSPVGVIAKQPSQKELQESLKQAKARKAAATDEEERAFYDARVVRIESQITGAMSPGHRLDAARKQREEAEKKLAANFKHFKVAQDNCARACQKFKEADEYYNKVREETAGVDVPAPAPDLVLAPQLHGLLSCLLPHISSEGVLSATLSPEQVLELQTVHRLTAETPPPSPDLSAAAASHAESGAPARRVLDAAETINVVEDDESMDSEDLQQTLQANFNQEEALRTGDAIEAEAEELLERARAQATVDAQAAAPSDRYSPYPAEAGRAGAFSSALAPFGKATKAASLA